MAETTYKGYAIIATGDQAGIWGDTLNSDVFGIVDNNMGGIVSKTPAGSNITLTPDEAQCALIRLTGTGPSAAIQVLSSNQGFYFVENLCTGSFSITITNGVSGVVVPNGMRVTIFADATNGCRIFGNLGLVTGTSQPFFNSSVPTGWTKSTGLDDGTIRIVSGTGGGTGGSSNFTDVFTSRFVSKANLPNYNLNVSDPGHTHSYTSPSSSSPRNLAAGSNFQGNDTRSTGVSFCGISVNSGGSGTAMDFNVKYINAIRGVVN